MCANPLITVFTPTYNREKVLYRVYESLIAQTFQNFEWLIVDDGSTDGTTELVEAWRKDSATFFDIRYLKQKNSHKKTAHNYAVREARGELFLPFDSDDRCVPDALERLAHHWFTIPEEERGQFSAVTALCIYENGRAVGDDFPCQEWIDSDSLAMRYRHRVRGEKWGVQRLDILKQYPFPDEISGHVPESVVWSRIAEKYKTRFVNEKLRIYCQDNFGDVFQVTNERDVRKHAEGHLYWKRIVLSAEITYFRYHPLSFFLDAARLNRFYLHCSNKRDSAYWPGSFLGNFLAVVMFPVGWLWWLQDQIKGKSLKSEDAAVED